MDWPQDNQGRLAVAAVECSADPRAAFGALRDVGRWPEWYPGLLAAEGSAVAGGPLKLRFRGGRLDGGGGVEGRFEEVVEPRALTWSGRRAAVVGFFTFRVAERPGGGCRLSASAFFTGVRVPVLTRRLAARIEGEHRAALEALARRLEAGDAAG